MSVCVRVCVCVCVCVCMCVCMCVCVCAHACMYIHVATRSCLYTAWCLVCALELVYTYTHVVS